ncbi:hypothetical protein [Saccharopolyspora sp. NPDC003762]
MSSVDQQVDASMRPHLAALEASRRAGFRFVYRSHAGDMFAVQGIRVDGRYGVLDLLEVRSPLEALAARVRIEDLDFFSPTTRLWEKQGAVADVVMELLGLDPPVPETARDVALHLMRSSLRTQRIRNDALL